MKKVLKYKLRESLTYWHANNADEERDEYSIGLEEVTEEEETTPKFKYFTKKSF